MISFDGQENQYEFVRLINEFISPVAFQGEMKRYLFPPDRVPVMDQIKDSTEVYLAVPLSLLR